jgi:hypothetical protein
VRKDEDEKKFERYEELRENEDKYHLNQAGVSFP